MKPVKGYTSPTVCIDGENTHEWEDRTMQEEGRAIPIRVCKKCGYWS